ncbi:MAG: GAF domain-containing protein [Fibrobacteres bacterium]|nr:GAF domain-containing protein [Fibrobacterota bacterium]
MNRKRTFIFQLLFLAAVLTGLFFAIRYWTMGPLRESLISEKEREIRLSLPEIQKTIKESDFQEPRELIGSITKELRGRFSLLRVVVLDTKGRILSATEGFSEVTVEHAPEALSCLDARQVAFYRPSREHALNLVISDPLPGPCRGGVLVSFSTSDVDDMLSQIAFRATLVAALFIIFLFSVEVFRFHTLAGACSDLRRGFSFLREGIHVFEPKGVSGGAKDLVSDFKTALTAEKDRDLQRNILIEKSKALAVLRNRDELHAKLFADLKDAIAVEQQILMEISDDVLVVTAVNGYSTSVVQVGEAYRANEDVFNEAMEFGRPLIIDDPSEIQQNQGYRAVLAKSGNSALLPLTLGNEVVGLLHVARPSERGFFTTAEMEKGAILTGGAAIAILHGSSPQEGNKLSEQHLPVIRHFRDAASFQAASIPLFGKNGSWSEWFALGSEKGGDITLVCASSERSSLRLPLRHKLEGILASTAQLKRQIGNLSLFSLSTISKMKQGPERDKLMDLFKYSPFSVEGIEELIKAALGAEAGAVNIDVIRFDSRRALIHSHLYRFILYTVGRNGARIISEFPAKFDSEALYVVLPDSFPGAADLSLNARTDDLNSLLTEIRAKTAAGDTPSAINTPAALVLCSAIA